jgi:hypothetical protein
MRGGADEPIHFKKRNDFKQFTREMRPSLHDPSNIIRCQGFVFKLSRAKKWQKRFFQLAGHYLRYYADQKCKEVKGAVDLVDLELVEVDTRYNGVFMKLEFKHRGLKREVQLKMLASQAEKWRPELQYFIDHKNEDGYKKRPDKMTEVRRASMILIQQRSESTDSAASDMSSTNESKIPSSGIERPSRESKSRRISFGRDETYECKSTDSADSVEQNPNQNNTDSNGTSSSYNNGVDEREEEKTKEGAERVGKLADTGKLRSERSLFSKNNRSPGSSSPHTSPKGELVSSLDDLLGDSPSNSQDESGFMSSPYRRGSAVHVLDAGMRHTVSFEGFSTRTKVADFRFD